MQSCTCHRSSCVYLLDGWSSDTNTALSCASGTRLVVDKVVRAPPSYLLDNGDDASRNVCQCWSADASVFAVSHGRRVAFYSVVHGFELLLTMVARYSVTSMDIASLPRRLSTHSNGTSAASADHETQQIAPVYLLAIGTAFGAHLYQVEFTRHDAVDNQDEHIKRNAADGQADTSFVPALASAYSDAHVCFAKFSHDGETVALGTVDGRLFVRRLHDFSENAETTTASALSTFGRHVLALVLVSPRVTSISFAPCDTKLAVATRKGNVYVLVRDAATGDDWRLHPLCRAWSENPKVPATASAATAVAMQTLVSWWGTAAASVLVIASRSANFRLEVVDVASGKRVHAIQIESRSAMAGDDDLLMGLCTLQVAPSGPIVLVCHDSRPSLALVEWPLLATWIIE